jgi:hypothetical protein
MRISIYTKKIINFIYFPEFFSCLGYIVGWIPEYFGCLEYIVSCGYPTRNHTRTRGNSVAHVWTSTEEEQNRHRTGTEQAQNRHRTGTEQEKNKLRTNKEQEQEQEQEQE